MAAPRRAAPLLLRMEDVALAGWNLVAVPVGAALGGWTAGGPAPLLGLVELLAVGGAIVALATRTPGTPLLTTESFRAWALAGPLIGAVALVGSSAAGRLGLGNADILGVVALVAIVAAFVLADRLPIVEERWRRLLVAPFVFVSAGFFVDIAAGLLEGFDVRDVASAIVGGSSTDPQLAGVAAILGFGLLAGSAVFYAMLVIAPRELAAPEPRPIAWLARFLVFIATAIVGASGAVIL